MDGAAGDGAVADGPAIGDASDGSAEDAGVPSDAAQPSLDAAPSLDSGLDADDYWGTSYADDPSYTGSGQIYYVSPNGTGLSTDVGSPGALNDTVNQAPSGSVIILLAGSYPGGAFARAGVQLKLVAQTPAHTDTDVGTGARIGQGEDSALAKLTSGLSFDGFTGVWVEGLAFQRTCGTGIEVVGCPNSVIRLSRFDELLNTDILARGASTTVIVEKNYFFNDDPYEEGGRPQWRTDYAVRLGPGGSDMRIRRNVFEGDYNRILSTKWSVETTLFQHNWVSIGGWEGIFHGQETDADGVDKSSGLMTVADNLFESCAPDAQLIHMGNAVRLRCLDNEIQGGTGLLYRSDYGYEDYVVGPLHPVALEIDGDQIDGAWTATAVGLNVVGFAWEVANVVSASNLEVARRSATYPSMPGTSFAGAPEVSLTDCTNVTVQ